MAKEKDVAKLSKEDALAELEVLAEKVEFDEEYSEKTSLKDLRRLVKEGRAALAEAEDEDEESLGGDDDSEEEDADEDDDVDLEESGPKGKGVHVYDKNGKHVRTYTAKEHGKEYRALAKQFIEKPGREGYSTKETK